MAGDRLTLRISLGWAIGTAVTSLIGTTSAIFLLRYLIDFVGLGAFVAGLVLAATKLFDVVMSTVVGYSSDRLNSRWGRRRPFMAAGCVTAGIGVALAFHIPTRLSGTGAMGFAMGALFLLSLGYAAFGTPHLAMPVELSSDKRERARMIGFRVYVMGFTQILGGVVSPMLLQAFGNDRGAYGQMAAVIGAMIAAIGLLCVWATATAPRVVGASPSGQSFWRALPTIRHSRLFLCIVLIKVTFLTGSIVHMVTVSFYARYVLQADASLLSAMLIGHSVGMIISQPLWVWLGQRIGKPAGFVVGAAVYAAFSLAWLGFGPAVPWLLIASCAVLNGIGAGGIMFYSEALLPDGMEQDFLLNGVRREGVLAAIYNYADRVSQTLGMMLGGLALAAFGYVAPTPDHPITAASQHAVTTTFGYVPAAFVAASCLWLLVFGLLGPAHRRPVLSAERASH